MFNRAHPQAHLIAVYDNGIEQLDCLTRLMLLLQLLAVSSSFELANNILARLIVNLCLDY